MAREKNKMIENLMFNDTGDILRQTFAGFQDCGKIAVWPVEDTCRGSFHLLLGRVIPPLAGLWSD